MDEPSYKRTARKRLAEMQANPYDRAHGTSTGYKYGCRCDWCVRAESDRKAKAYAKNPSKFKARSRRYYMAHKEERSEYAHEYYMKLKLAYIREMRSQI